MWTDLSALKKEFELESTLDEAEVRSALKKLLAIAHPDQTKGEFADEAQKKRFERLSQALDYLKSELSQKELSIQPNQALAKIVEQQNALVQTLSKNQELILTALTSRQEAATAAEGAKRTEELMTSARNSLRQQSVRRHRPITISGASLAALATLLLSFKGPLEELAKSQIFGSFANAQLLITSGIICIGVSAAAFAFLSNMHEHRESERKELILTEAGFKQFLFSKPLLDALEHMYLADEPFTGISLVNLTEAVEDFANLRDAAAAQAVAEAFFQRLVDRKLATVADGNFVSPTLKLSEGLDMDLRYGDHERLTEPKWISNSRTSKRTR